MDTSQIRNERDLKAWLEQQQAELAALRTQLNDLEVSSSAATLELAEDKVERLHAQGMDYNEAFELVTGELEASERQIKAKSEQAQRERIELELQELTPEQECLILEQGEEG